MDKVTIEIEYDVGTDVIILTQDNNILFGIITDYSLKGSESKVDYEVKTFLDKHHNNYYKMMNSDTSKFKIYNESEKDYEQISNLITKYIVNRV